MSAFQEGAIISAQPLVAGESLNVVVLSSKPIGQGATSLVYAGRTTGQASMGDADTPPGTAVAMKVFHALVQSDDEENWTQALRRELRTARRVRHPHILPFIGMAVVNYQPVLISLYMKNGDMMHYLRQNTSVDRTVLIIQAAEAVCHLHTVHGLVHGDLKAENILISDEGTVLLADFGLSTFIDKVDTSTRTSSTARARFTAHFAAPELLTSYGPHTSPPKTVATDVYAFGMLTLQVFSGQSPWAEYAYVSIFLRVGSGTIHDRPGPESTRLGLVQMWWNVCLECWQFRPEARPSMQQVLVDLKEGMMLRTLFHNLFTSFDVRQHPEKVSDAHVDVLNTLRSFDLGFKWLVDRMDLVVSAMLEHADVMLPVAGSHDGLVGLVNDLLVQGSLDLGETVLSLPEVLGGVELGSCETYAFSFHDHGKPLFAVRFRDRQYVSAASNGPDHPSSYNICTWDIRTGELVDVCPLTTGPLQSVTDCPDVSLLVEGFKDTFRRWDFLGYSNPDLPTEVQPEAAHEPGCAFAISPDGYFILSGSQTSGLHLWRTADGETVGRERNCSALAVAFCPCDATLLATGAPAGEAGTVHLWRWDGRAARFIRVSAPLVPSTPSASDACTILFSPDGACVACGYADGTIQCWDVQLEENYEKHLHNRSASPKRGIRDRLRWLVTGHAQPKSDEMPPRPDLWEHAQVATIALVASLESGAVHSMAFSLSGRHIVSGSSDGAVRIWDISTGTAVGVLRGHIMPVWSVAISPDGTRIASCSADHTVRVWDRVVVLDGSDGGGTSSDCEYTQPDKDVP